MSTDEQVVLDCPCCQRPIHRPLRWFKQACFTCPACGGGLTDGQFAAIVEELDRAFEDTVAAMLRSEQGCACGGCAKHLD